MSEDKPQDEKELICCLNCANTKVDYQGCCSSCGYDMNEVAESWAWKEIKAQAADNEEKARAIFRLQSENARLREALESVLNKHDGCDIHIRDCSESYCCASHMFACEQAEEVLKETKGPEGER